MPNNRQIATSLRKAAAAIDPVTYREWLEQHDYKVDRYAYADHKHFVEAVMSVEKDLQGLVNKHARPGGSFPVRKFSQEEADTLRAALKILQGGLIPLASLKIQKDDDPIFD